MQINFTVTETDYVQYNLYHLAHSPAAKRSLQLWRWGLPIAFIVLITLMGSWHSVYGWLPPVVFAVAWWLGLPAWHRRSIAKNVKRLMYEGQSSEFLGDFEVTLGDSTLKYAGNGQTIEVVYSRVAKIVRDKERLYIYLGSLTAIIMPVKYFADEGEMQRFLDLLEQKRAA